MIEIELRTNQRSYPIFIGLHSIKKAGAVIVDLRLNPSKIAVITDETVNGIYGENLLKSLKTTKADIITIVLPGGESHKHSGTMRAIYNRIFWHKFDRSSMIVTMGGGVVSDIGGYAAATAFRGIPYIHIPTTLVAQTDAAIGGKTGVNHAMGKNLIGAFYQPWAVVIDPTLLWTLPQDQFLNGIAENIKHAVVGSPELFDILDRKRDRILNYDPDALIEMIEMSVRFKGEIVERDERESGARAILNYGHTIGHGIESAGKYSRYSHGQAISIGMDYAARIALDKKKCSKRFFGKQRDMIESYKLPVEIAKEVSRLEILKKINIDKKRTRGKLRFILPRRIGKAEITYSITHEVLEHYLLESGD